MPVWNGERFLKEAIDSILAQTFSDFEFIILDDGSTDSTLEIVRAYAASDSRVRLVQLEHGGIVVALNRGISEAKADWIARMDCDDIALPNRFEEQWSAIEKNPDAILCHTHVHIVGEPQYVTPAGRFIRSKALLALRLCFQCPIIHPTVLLKKDAVIDCGGFVPAERHAEDYGLWGRLLMRGNVVGVAQPLLQFRVHGGSISKLQAEAQQTITRDVAVRHCQWFMDLDLETASRAYDGLRGKNREAPLSEWLWFVRHCVPRMKWKSLEMWAWIANRTLQIIKVQFARK